MPHKGQDLLVRMLPRVRREWPECRLQVVGEGKSRPALEALARDLGVDRQVKFLGLRDDVHQLLTRADAFVYASWFEGFANAFAEAISRGLPVVAVDLPVFREIAPAASVILVKRDEEAFATAVIRVLGDLSSYRDAALRESHRFRERFSVQRYVEGTEAVYGQAARHRGAV
jgi:glycosyltransferase involved in cell wall biosynthesis